MQKPISRYQARPAANFRKGEGWVFGLMYGQCASLHGGVGAAAAVGQELLGCYGAGGGFISAAGRTTTPKNGMDFRKGER